MPFRKNLRLILLFEKQTSYKTSTKPISNLNDLYNICNTRTGLMADIVQHAMLLPVLVHHLRFHFSLEHLEEKINYRFQNR